MANTYWKLNAAFYFVVIFGSIVILALLVATGSKSQHSAWISLNADVKTLLQYQDATVDSSFLTDDLLQNNRNGSYPSWLPCPYTNVRRTSGGRRTPVNTSEACILHQSSASACKDAAGSFGRPDQKLDIKKCTESSSPDICTFTGIHQSSLKCDESVCLKDVVVATVDLNIGIITEWQPIKPFSTSNMMKFVVEKMKENHNFCFIKCSGISQVLAFPPKLIQNKNVDPKKQININMVVLDSISRSHFFRMLRESVDAMRKVVYDETIDATVLDFELFQSISQSTFDNMRPLFSGVIQGIQDFTKVSKSVSPLGIHVLSTEFKKHGYQTMFQEDSCWHDSWGNGLNDLERSSGGATKQRWTQFQKVVAKHNVDNYGMTHFCCEVLKKYGRTNHYDSPAQVCFNGQFYNEYFLQYIQSMITAIRTTNGSAPLLSYHHSNTGHTPEGTRIRNVDHGLAIFIQNMAREPNTLTLLLSDHGHTRTSYGQTEEGRRELYHPHLFMIVPHYVAGLLGRERMEALVVNQKRLLTTYDIHKALISLHDEKKKHSTDYRVSGLFSKIPANRTCSDLPLLPLARCQCEGDREIFDDNSLGNRWIAEFALGTLNNLILKQHSKDIQTKGYGNCVRLIGSSFRKIVKTKSGKLVTMDLHINTSNVGLNEDEIFTVVVEVGGGALTLKTYSRLTLYNTFKVCADKTVNIDLCACDKANQTRKTGLGNLSSKEMKTFISVPMFASETKVKNLHGDCLFEITRQHSSRFSIAYEIANSCDKAFKISVTGSTEYIILSRSLPFELTVGPNSIHFMFSAIRQILNHSYMDIKITAVGM